MCPFHTWFQQFIFILVMEDILLDLRAKNKAGAEKRSWLCEEEGCHP